MPCACVDIGTNTTRLLVAEREGAGLRELVAVRRFLRLAPGPDGAIPAATVARLADVVAGHVRLARDHRAGEVSVVATAAIRAATNREELCRRVRRAAGVDVEVLSGEDEASLAFSGAIATLAQAPPDGLLGVVDVGGGSSELVAGTATGGVTWWASFPLGSGLLTDRHVRSDPPAAAELDAVRAEIDAVLAELEPPLPRVAYAAGGSATSLARVAGTQLDPGAIGRALAALTAEPAAAAAGRFGVHAERVRLLPASLLLLEGAWGTFGGAPLKIAGGGLREGVLLRALSRRS
jgi:exopolyphosphatase/guanosine-5'-triphosphate,3'-diphosphate pyrophosphatase